MEYTADVWAVLGRVLPICTARPPRPDSQHCTQQHNTRHDLTVHAIQYPDMHPTSKHGSVTAH